jgi:hypothetical protein
MTVVHNASLVIRGWSFQASLGLILRSQILVESALTSFSTRDSNFPFRDNPAAKKNRKLRRAAVAIQLEINTNK